jgi:hypothetical protein
MMTIVRTKKTRSSVFSEEFYRGRKPLCVQSMDPFAHLIGRLDNIALLRSIPFEIRPLVLHSYFTNAYMPMRFVGTFPMR